MFFRPIIDSLKERFEVFITARDYSETIMLLDALNLKYEPIGKHGGKSIFGKVLSSAKRIYAFSKLFRKTKPSLAISHNSYDQIIYSFSAGIRNITFMDYDKQPANHVAFRLSYLVVVQEWFPEDALKRFGAKRYIKYKGLKEEVYLDDFVPSERFIRNLSVKRPFVVARPPTIRSLYSEGYGIFWETLRRLKSKGCDVRLLVRNPEDEGIAKSMGIEVLPKPIDGPQIVFWADIFIGGGGTMTREAVILGTPAYTVLPRLGSVDLKLHEMGYLRIVNSPDDVKVDLKKDFRVRRFNPNIREDIIGIIVQNIGD